MKSVWLIVVLFVAAACGDSEGAVAGRLGWKFDYRDWTEAGSTSDVRACDNSPGSFDGDPYDPIAVVHVLLEDPAGQVPGVDEDIPCAQGEGARLTPLKGLTAMVYELTLEAKNAAGAVLYRHGVVELDLKKPRDEVATLAAATGEMRFFPRFPGGTLNCPADAETLRISVRESVDGVVQDTVLVQLLRDACVDSFGTRQSDEVRLRNVPTMPAEGFNGSFVPEIFEIKVEVLDDNDLVTYCAKVTRPIKPGNSNLNDDITLSAGSCG